MFPRPLKNESDTQMCFGPLYSGRQCRLGKGRSLYLYEDHKLGGGTGSPEEHKIGWGTRAHKVHKGCWQVGVTTGTGVLWRYSVPSWEVTWSTWCGRNAPVDVPWLTCLGRQLSLPCPLQPHFTPFGVPDNCSSGPRPGWDHMFNDQLLGIPKWSEIWLLGTLKWSEIWLLGTPKWSEIWLSGTPKRSEISFLKKI